MMNNLDFTHTVEEWTHFMIPLKDGTQLAARAWCPLMLCLIQCPVFRIHSL